MTIVLVMIGAAIGAPLRYLMSRYIRPEGQRFPWGTFSANLAGSALLGFIASGFAHHGISNDVVALIGTGLCGAWTTYSTFTEESDQMMKRRAALSAALNICINVFGALGAALLGWNIASAFWNK